MTVTKCEVCHGSTPLMIGAVRSKGEELTPYRVDVDASHGLLVIATPSDESYVAIEHCPLCGAPVGQGRVKEFVRRVEEYFNA